MKLMVVTPYFYPKIGGLENYAYNIAKGLKKQFGYEIVIITSNHKNKEYKKEVLEGMKIYRLPRQFKVSNTPISFKWKKQIKEIIEKEKPDVINAHSPVPFISDVTARVCGDVPFLLGYHASTLYKKNNLIANTLIFGYNIFIGNKTFKLATKILPVSAYVKLQFNKNIQKKSIVLTNAINSKEITKIKNIKKYDLIFLGSLDKTHSWKGLEQIINSIKIYVTKYNQKIKLIVLGNGDYKKHYKQLTKNLNLTNNIIFVGSKFGDEKNKFLENSKILIAYPTTENDAFPTIFLEAWAKGLLIISSKIGATPFIIEDKKDGFLVEPNSPEKLAEGIYELLKNKKLQKKIIENGYKKVKENFTWEKKAKEMNKIIEEVLR